jgi:hypothetical protein
VKPVRCTAAAGIESKVNQGKIAEVKMIYSITTPQSEKDGGRQIELGVFSSHS